MDAGHEREPTPTEALARIVRHEVGDLLQTVYAASAILRERLPEPLTLERKIITDLRTRAETCRHLLDAVHDYACPMLLTPETVSPDGLARVVAEREAARFPQLRIQVDTRPETPAISADPRRLSQLAQLLVANACESAVGRVDFRVGPGPGGEGVEWVVTDDGPGVPEGQLPRIFSPFPAARHSVLGLRLALAQKIVGLHGGRITAENAAGGGFRVVVVLPTTPPNAP